MGFGWLVGTTGRVSCDEPLTRDSWVSLRSRNFLPKRGRKERKRERETVFRLLVESHSYCKHVFYSVDFEKREEEMNERDIV